MKNILARAFDTDDEARLWDYLVENDPSLKPEGVRLAVVAGQPVACTVVLPREIRGRVGWVDGAVITLVACLPEMQGRGLGGRTVRDALSYIKGQGWTLGMLYGHPTYYPRFDFVPVLPSYRTTLVRPREIKTADALREAVDGDLPMLADLYAEHLAEYPCAVPRDASSWLWRTRHPDVAGVHVLREGRGYAFVSYHTDAAELIIHEAATDMVDGTHLLSALQTLAASHDLRRLRLDMPPRHPLVVTAGEHGAEQRISPPSAGMAAIVDPNPLLPPGYWLDEGELLHGVRRIGRVDLPALVPYILGARGLDTDPSGWPITDLSPDIDPDRLAADWPAAFPHWSLDPFWT